jgi:predicted negative regulator of RcsB-dependent stress response
VVAADDEQLDRLREFWAQYGKPLMLGLAVGVALLASWFGWQTWQARQQTDAALAFHQIEQLSAAHQPQQAIEAARKLAADHSGTVYAALALLVGAHESMGQNDPTKAAIYLQKIIDQTKEPAIVAVARLRLARVEWAQNKPDAALATLKTQTPPASFVPLYDELTGDIEASQKHWAAARSAYAQALAGPGADTAFIRIKLDNLPAQQKPPASAPPTEKSHS